MSSQDSELTNSIFNKILLLRSKGELDLKEGSFRAKSYNGYPVNVLKSAIQKYIRRGQLDKAVGIVFW